MFHIFSFGLRCNIRQKHRIRKGQPQLLYTISGQLAVRLCLALISRWQKPSHNLDNTYPKDQCLKCLGDLLKPERNTRGTTTDRRQTQADQLTAIDQLLVRKTLRARTDHRFPDPCSIQLHLYNQ